MNVTATVLGGSQQMRALQRANEVRVARADLKRRVARGTISAADVILHPPEQIESMGVGELLISQRQWGHSRCRKILTAIPLSETKTVGSMTDRQRHALAALLADPQRTAPAAHNA